MFARGPSRPMFVGAPRCMSSHTRTHPTSASPRRGGLDLGTLLIAAISSVAAATVVSRLWQAGTVMATAMTPVLVTLVKEALERPAQRVSKLAARSATAEPPRTGRRRPRAAAAVGPAPSPPVASEPALCEPAQVEPAAWAPPASEAAPDPALSAVRIYRAERRVGRRWKLAIGTGLLAFVIGVAVMTVPELVAGRSVVSGSHDTTIFGGQRRATPTKTTQKTTTTEKKAVPKVVPQDEAPTNTTTTPTTPAQPAPDSQQPAQPAQPAPSTQPAPQTRPAPEQQPAPTTP